MRVVTGAAILAELRAIAEAMARLPTGAEVTVEWPEAGPELLLLFANEEESEFAEYPMTRGRAAFEVEIWIGEVLVRARRVAEGETARLQLVRGGRTEGQEVH